KVQQRRQVLVDAIEQRPRTIEAFRIEGLLADRLGQPGMELAYHKVPFRLSRQNRIRSRIGAIAVTPRLTKTRTVSSVAEKIIAAPRFPSAPAIRSARGLPTRRQARRPWIRPPRPGPRRRSRRRNSCTGLRHCPAPC